MALIVTGLLLLTAALSLVVYNVRDSRRAAEASEETAETLIREIDSAKAAHTGAKVKFPDADGEMPYTEIDGVRYIGILEVPSKNLTLPVRADWSYAGLRDAPCRYSGSYYTDDMVLCAHNYASHFGPLRNLESGSDVYFTNVYGEIFHYAAVSIENVEPTDVEKMTVNARDAKKAQEAASSGKESESGAEGSSDAGAEADADTQGLSDWDLTLFTCNASGQVRVAVRCERAG